MTLSALHACVPADDYAPVAKKTQWFAMFFLCIPVGFALGKPAHMHAPREGRISAGAARGWGDGGGWPSGLCAEACNNATCHALSSLAMSSATAWRRQDQAQQLCALRPCRSGRRMHARLQATSVAASLRRT